MDKSSAAANGAAANLHPTSTRESSTSSTRRADGSLSLRQASATPSTTTSANGSPLPSSRETSPSRPSARSHAAMKAAATAAAAAAAAAATTTASTSSTSSTRAQNSSQRSQSTKSTQSTQTTQTQTRSRRNSQQEGSPARTSRSNIPTLAAQPRPPALSAATTPTLLPVASETSPARPSVAQKAETSRDSPRWPISPRLRSPPPSVNRTLSTNTNANANANTNLPSDVPPSPSASSSGAATGATPSPAPGPTSITAPVPPISLQRTAVDAATAATAATQSDSESEDLHLQTGMRTPLRGVMGSVPTLETVQEASPLGSPQVLDAALEKLETASIVSDAGMSTISTTSEVAEVSPVKTLRAKQIAHHLQTESGSESGGGPGGGGGGGGSSSSHRNGRRTGPTSNPAPSLTSRHSSVSRNAGKGKSNEGSQATMTVETETVTSIPNLVVGPATGQPIGSLRTKPSSETIRPKKDKKKSRRNQSAVTPGTAASKADIFEAKVASAVDEANTSDSEETFVYDSNPAETRDRPHRFHHSRTPSATSLATNDRSGMRSIHSVMESAGPSVTVKRSMKSMKFVNTFGNTSGNDSGLGEEEIKGGSSGRGGANSGPGSSRGTARLHHHVGPAGGSSHIGRWGLSGPKNSHQSIFDNESPFPVNSTMRLKLPHGGSNSSIGRVSGPASPRGTGGGNNGNSNGNGGGNNVYNYYSKRGSGGVPPGGYDMDETTTGGADDERTPLMGRSMIMSNGTMGGGSPRTGRGARRQHHMSLRALEHQSPEASYRPPASFLNRFASCLVLTVMLMLVISGAIGFMFATSQPLEDIELIKIGSVIASEQELMFDLTVRAHNPNVVVVTVDAADMEVFAKSPHAGTDSEWWKRPHGELSDLSHDTVTIDENVPRDQPDSSPNFLLGKFTQFDNPLSFEGSFFHHGLSKSRSGVRITRPGNGTDGGSERWERILDDEFDLIVKGVLRYSLPLSQRVRSALIEGRITVKPNSADNPPKNNDTATISRLDDEDDSDRDDHALPVTVL